MDTLMVISNENKKNILLNKKGLENIKYIGFRELKEKLSFSIDKRALYEVIRRENLSVSNAKIILDNLYFLDGEVKSDQVDNLRRIYEYLNKENLIIRNDLFVNSIRGMNVVIYGRDFLNREEELLLDGINYTFMERNVYEREIPVFECETLEDEVRNLAGKIVKLVKSGVRFNQIKIINLNDEYRMLIEKIFPRYNILTSIGVEKNVFSVSMIKKFLAGSSILDGIKDLEMEVTSLGMQEVYDTILNVVNNYLSLPDDNITKSIIEHELKDTTIKNNDVIDGVMEGNIDTIYKDDEYIFIVNFNQGVIPSIYKDEDYLSDNIKIKLGRMTSLEKTLDAKNQVHYFVKHNKNIVISYKKKSLTEVFYPSVFLEELDILKIKPCNDYDSSDLDNKIILSRMLDNYYKFGVKGDNLDILYNNYKDLPYKTYDNKFSGISEENKKSVYKDKLILSSTSLDSYNRCAFRYYLNYVLKLGKYEDSFMQFVGNIFHYVLSKYNLKDFNQRQVWDEYISDNEKCFNVREKFFLDKLYSELEFIIGEIKRQKSYSTFCDEFYETKIVINPTNEDNIEFVGIIDKILYNEKEGLVSVIDYKTGSVKLDLSTLQYGIGIQLPIYLYLIKNLEDFRDDTLVGFYIQRIINSPVIRDNNKTYLEQRQKNLYLQGYSLGEENTLEKFDSSYQDSKVIKSLRVSSKGFYNYSKVLSKEEMDSIIEGVSKNIEESIVKIKQGDYTINPKSLGLENIGCEFCNYKDICFRTNEDIVNLSVNKNEELLEGSEE